MSFKNRSVARIKTNKKDEPNHVVHTYKCGSHVFSDQELEKIIDENDGQVSDLNFLSDYKKYNSK